MTNIALVVLDTLRKDAFDEHFEWLPGTRFDNAWSPSAWTTPAHAALFGGAYPSELGVYAKTESLDCERQVLAEALSEGGYTTRAFSANANIAAAYDFDRGFDSFRHSWRGRKHDENIFDWGDFVSETSDQGPSRFLRAIYRCVTEDVATIPSLRYGIKMKARDMDITEIAGVDDGARKALSETRSTEFGDDEFYFMNLMEAHGPYDPPAEYRTTDYTASPGIDDTIGDGPDEPTDVIRQAYDDSVRYLSDIYQDIFAELSAEFDYVVTLGDHGELFGEDGVWAHNHGIYPGLVHVPVSIYTGDDETTHSDRLVSLVDVHRTVAELAGVTVKSRGRNLLADTGAGADTETSAETEPRDLLVERFGLRTKRIEQMRANGYDEATIERYDAPLFGAVVPRDLYRYDTIDGTLTRGEADGDVDPDERLATLQDGLDQASVDLDDGEVPDDVQQRLEELGYA